MVEITIISLIYKSKKLAKAIHDSLYKYTPMLVDGRAELLFVANDPTIEVVEFLKSQSYSYVINSNEYLTDEELFKLGYGKPEYMRRVYQGYNLGIMRARGQRIVLINSDNFFSNDWLENLIKYSDYKKVVCSTLIEPGHDKFGVFPCAIQKNFGKTVETYKEKEFQEYASKMRKTGYTSGGAYMPCLLYKDIAIMAGLYPGGNIAGESFDKVIRYGDEFFYDKLKKFGVEHITSKDSIVYHLKEGEKSEESENTTIVKGVKYRHPGLADKHKVTPTNLINYIQPEIGHLEIIDTLGKKFTAIIMHFSSAEELRLQIDQMANQATKNIEIVVVYSDKDLVKNRLKNVKYIYVTDAKKYTVFYDLLHKAYGEYLVVTNPQGVYEGNLFEKIIEKDAIYHIGNGGTEENNSLIDSIGNYVIPKNILLSNIATFLGPILGNGNLEVNFNRQKVVTIPFVQVRVEANEHYIPKYKKSLPYKAMRKIYREGPRSATKAVLYRAKRRK
jgi:hypothetical protein